MGCALPKNLRRGTPQEKPRLAFLASLTGFRLPAEHIFQSLDLSGMAWYGLMGMVKMTDRDKNVDALAAASLSILAGVGHLYLGIGRGYFFLVVSLILIIISKFFWPTGWLIYLQWVILAGFDAFSFGKRGRGFF